ncbi:MAG: tetratricopeptide repeat protein [Bacteroidetes bacterium]|nr:tetratricopeptide repeat protein [Bacteroidota bacterium]
MKKALFLLVIIASIATQSFSQKQGQEKIDSLFTILNSAKEDTTKVKTLTALTYEFLSYDPDTGIYFAYEALALATKINYKMGIADAHLAIGNGLSNIGKYEEALKNLNDVLMLCDELITSATSAYKLIIMKRKGDAYNRIGTINQFQGNYFEGIKNLSSAMIIYQEMGNKKGIANVYNNIGTVYYYLGNYPEALKNFFAALKIQEEIGDKINIAGSYNNIGVIYMDQGNYAEALKNYFMALKLNEELGDKRGKAENLTNIGNIYEDHQGNHAEALKIFLEALKISEELGDIAGEAIDLSNIGIVYSMQGYYAEALKYYLASLKIAEELGDKDQMAHRFNYIGAAFIKLNKNNEGSRYLNKGLSLAKEIGNPREIDNSYRFLAELDSIQGNFKQSLENYKMYIIYRDSLVNEENTKKTVQIQMQYEFDKKESLAKAEQEKKDALALEELQKQKLIRNGFVGGVSVLLIFAVIISIIMRQHEKIRLIKKERNRISKELHDDIGAELTRITVISQHLQKKTNKDDEMQEKLRKISEAGKKVLGSIGEIIWTMNQQKNNLESLFAYIRRFVTEYLEMSGIEVNIEFPDEIPANSVSDEYRRNIFLVIKEAIYNITKHSKATRVRLTMNFRKRLAEFEISDNGTGFSVQEKQNWGNGLSNMNQRMKDIGGNFKISSDKNQGTLIKLIFPVRGSKKNTTFVLLILAFFKRKFAS